MATYNPFSTEQQQSNKNTFASCSIVFYNCTLNLQVTYAGNFMDAGGCGWRQSVMYFSISFYQADSHDPSLRHKKQDSASVSPPVTKLTHLLRLSPRPLFKVLRCHITPQAVSNHLLAAGVVVEPGLANELRHGSLIISVSTPQWRAH